MMGHESSSARAARSAPALRQATGWQAGPFLISTLPPGPRQRWIARALVIVLAAAFLGTVAYRDVQLQRYDAFVPIANTIICLNDVITAALLYAQFSVTRSRALLALASGFLFKSLTMIPHALTFPGAFAPSGLLGARVQTTAWLYMTQHLVFVLSAVAYTLLRERRTESSDDDGSAAISIGVAVGGVSASIAAVTWLFIVGTDLLPPIMADSIHTTAVFHEFGTQLLLLEAVVSIVVFRRRATSMIDLWLKVAMCSWLIETFFQVIIRSRFSLVFYVSRSMGVVSSSFVLIVFLSESLMLHRRLVLAVLGREQEREGHRTAIEIVVGALAHELRQPLTAILLNEKACARLLSTSPQSPEDVSASLDDIRDSALRAGEIIDSVRTMFDAPGAQSRAAVDGNALVREAVELMRLDLEAHHVSVEFDLAPQALSIRAHRGQLLEVLLNGLKNAIESLATITGRRRDIGVRTLPLGANGIAITIEDSGAGVDIRVRRRVFEPFYTTKPQGMGLGLSICESIVSAHGGALTLEPGSPHGATLRIELPGSWESDVAMLERPRPCVPASEGARSEVPSNAARPARRRTSFVT